MLSKFYVFCQDKTHIIRLIRQLMNDFGDYKREGLMRLSAEAVEKANPLAHFIRDYCLHQSIQKNA
jgi:hypothetical protein